MNKIIAIRAFKDNYIWTIHSLGGSDIVVVDPGDADPVISYLHENNFNLEAILLTHHHWDHSGGILPLVRKYPHIKAYGPKGEKVDGINHFVAEGDEITLPKVNIKLKVIDIPGHTLGHIAFVDKNMLFCGDTLFSCGCGKIFEGTPEQMFRSLEKIKNLPKSIMIYCGHEYTLSNIAFAQTVDPNNKMLEKKLYFVKKLAINHPSLPVSLESELQTNPFLRCDNPAIIASVQNHCGFQLDNPIAVFTHLRQWKNQF